jgi:methionyl-tRNA synthetase
MNLAQFGNVYFDQNKPWELIKTDKERCGTVLNVCLIIAQALAVFMAPYLPYSSDEIWKILGNKDSVHAGNWDQALKEIKVGTTLEKPKPLFKKLALEEFMLEMDPFSKLDLRVAKVVDVKDHPQADTLYMLQVDLGAFGKRVIVTGMKPHYKKDEIKGKSIVIVANLRPAKIRGVESKGMLLAAEDADKVVSLLNPGDANPGSRIIVEGVPHEPVSVLEFEDFKKVDMKIGDNLEATYNGKNLKSEKGKVVSDRTVKKGAKIL